MNITTKYRTIRMYLTAWLITLGALSSICQAAKVIKATGEIIEGDVLGFIVLQAGSSETEEGLPVPLYVLCEGKRVSSISEKGVTCDENAKVLMRVTEKPTGQGQMAVLEDAANTLGQLKNKNILVFVVPSGTKAVALRPPPDLDVSKFRLLGTLELRNGLATLSTNVYIKTGKSKTYVPVQEINALLPVTPIQPDQRVALLTAAKTVFVISSGEKAPSGTGGFLTKMATKKYTYADAESAKKDVIKVVNESKRWVLSDSVEKADLVLSIDETNNSMGRHIIDKLWVFKGGAIPDKSNTQPLWFVRAENDFRSASRVTSWLEDDVKTLTELQTQKITSVSPIDGGTSRVDDHLTSTKPVANSTPAELKSARIPGKIDNTSDPAKDPAASSPTPKPDPSPADASAYLLSAKTIFVRGQVGAVQRATRGYLNPDGDRAKHKVLNVLSQWGRYRIVDDAAQADLIALVTESNRVIMGIQEQLRSNLSVYAAGVDLRDATPLWTGDAKEAFTKMPSTKVAEEFRKFVEKLR